MKGILFKPFLIEQIIARRKTQTRRMVKQAIGWDHNWQVAPIKEVHGDGIQRYEMRCGTQYSLPYFKSPYQIGDVVYVKEAFAVHMCNDGGDDYTIIKRLSDGGIVKYNTDMKPGNHSPLHLPAECARLFLKITNVRPERACDISGNDARAEGIEVRQFSLYGLNAEEIDHVYCAHFHSLFESINGRDSWNKWVFAYSFEKTKKP